MASELFLVRSNPFINPADVKASVEKRLGEANPKSWGEYPRTIRRAYKAFWDVFEADSRFRDNLVERLRRFMPRLLAIDYGQARVGLAVTDPEGRVAFPLRTLAWETREACLARCLALSGNAASRALSSAIRRARVAMKA